MRKEREKEPRHEKSSKQIVRIFASWKGKKSEHGWHLSGSACHANPEPNHPSHSRRTIVAERAVKRFIHSTHMAVGISVAAEHRPTSLDGATSTHMVMYVTSRCGLELSFFLPTPAWLAGLLPSNLRWRRLRGKTSWRNFWPTGAREGRQ